MSKWAGASRPRFVNPGLSHPWSLLATFSALALLLTACGQGSTSGTDAASSFDFDGKSVEIIVPTGVGGGTDTTARFMAKHIQGPLPGQSTLQVQNIESGSHVPGMNQYVRQRPSDGLHWLMSSGSGHLPYLFDEPQVGYNLAEMKPILATTVGNVALVRTDLGIEEPADLADLDRPLKFGAEAPIGSDTVRLLGFHILGIDTKAVFGLNEGPQRIAFEQGEIDAIYQTTPAYLSGGKKFVNRGIADLLFTTGTLENGKVVKDPAFPDTPTVKDVYKELRGKPPSGPAWEAYKALLGTTVTFSKVLWLHGDAPESAVSSVRKAANEMEATNGFYGDAKDVLGPYKVVVGEQEVSTEIKRAFRIKPEVREWLKDWLKEEYDVVPGE